ncbi:hypothetical protein NEPAR06_0921 [Nematocida parisii]|uniref:Uncharacterized protein n=1 Tax=Nematocida parisii (strain ERTm3) TaxID=935791 RepID=I3EDS5_NEMP3|nr:hypothetical protein NEQG_02495 [Nematocida parisii ERTm3]KAI5127570.1 hypothetical protein NEPAR08_0940 [Nematocida parisii]KAI5127845.1 hypothetical protein NEPAR03_1125 [Nematocida parisii]KAI5141639.1 hypothetical protein NEPAR04_1116 [Nematocida parisii]KAI5145610.1 hypothetical protein NEPAR07_1810 [Nematocida parisii]
MPTEETLSKKNNDNRPSIDYASHYTPICDNPKPSTSYEEEMPLYNIQVKNLDKKQSQNPAECIVKFQDSDCSAGNEEPERIPLKKASKKVQIVLPETTINNEPEKLSIQAYCSIVCDRIFMFINGAALVCVSAFLLTISILCFIIFLGLSIFYAYQHILGVILIFLLSIVASISEIKYNAASNFYREDFTLQSSKYRKVIKCILILLEIATFSFMTYKIREVVILLENNRLTSDLYKNLTYTMLFLLSGTGLLLSGYKAVILSHTIVCIYKYGEDVIIACYSRYRYSILVFILCARAVLTMVLWGGVCYATPYVFTAPNNYTELTKYITAVSHMKSY